MGQDDLLLDELDRIIRSAERIMTSGAVKRLFPENEQSSFGFSDFQWRFRSMPLFES